MRLRTGWLPAGLVAALCSFAAAQEITITGRAVDADGKPVEGAAVGVVSLGEFVDAAEVLKSPAATTDANGRYSITTRDERYMNVIVAATGQQICILRAYSQEGQSELPVRDALLLAGTTLRGRVRGPDGGALAGARIDVTDPIQFFGVAEMQFRSGTISSDKGFFAVPGVPHSGLRVEISAPGHAPHSMLAGHHTPLDITLKRTGFVRGRVLDEHGKPLGGIRVNTVTVMKRHAHDSATTDGDGTFTLSAPDAQRFRVNGYESEPPHRQFSSELLHGPTDDVVVTRPTAKESPTLIVRCIDATTKKPIAKFHASRYSQANAQPQTLWLYHLSRRREYEGSASFAVADNPNDELKGVVVDAAGHGFATATVPEEFGEPLVVELGPEATLTGVVTDRDTGKPLAGAAVVALPAGRSSGSGFDVHSMGATSDENGRYRVTRLRPGDYQVQVYGVNRPDSGVFSAKLDAAKEATLDLEVPGELWLEAVLVGGLGNAPNCVLSFASRGTSMGANSGFRSRQRQLAPITLGTQREFKLGPVGNTSFAARIWKPSRVRLGAGTVCQLGTVEPRVVAKLTLPELGGALFRGRVELPSDVATERIAVVLRPPADPRNRRSLLHEQPHAVGLAADGSFVLDIPYGTYALQLADLETGILFHTETEDVEIGPETNLLTIEPSIHWLELEFEPEIAGSEVIVQSLGLKMDRPRDGCRAFMQSSSRRNNTESSHAPVYSGTTQLRWLVPPAVIEITPRQTFDMLRPHSSGWRATPVDSAQVDIAQPVHRVKFKIPAPPSDEELNEGSDK